MLACPGLPVLACGFTCQSEPNVDANFPNVMVFASLVLTLNSCPVNTLICFSLGDIPCKCKRISCDESRLINSYNLAEFLLPTLHANCLKWNPVWLHLILCPNLRLKPTFLSKTGHTWRCVKHPEKEQKLDFTFSLNTSLFFFFFFGCNCTEDPFIKERHILIQGINGMHGKMHLSIN